jgi:soluble lytic murein transglycosylase-like protein
MQSTELWLMVATALATAVFQWLATRGIRRRRLADMRARYLAAQQAADKLLQQSRQQTAQLQQELAAARLVAKRLPRTEPAARPSSAQARDTLMRVLDEAPAKRPALPVDGFAETMPSMQFTQGGSSFAAL